VSNNAVRSIALFAIACLCCLSVGCAGFSSANTSPAKNVAGTTVTISGMISPSASGTATTVSLSGAASATTTTDSSGNYKFSGLASGKYTVTPSKSQFSFSPASQSMLVDESDVVGVNFSASQLRPTGGLTISGRISPAANGGATTVVLSGAASAATTTDSAGNFTFWGLSAGDYTVTPSKSGFSFSPASQHTTLSAASVIGVDFSASQAVSTTTYSIIGTVSPAANGTGVRVTLSGAARATTTTDSSGNYSFSGLAPGTYAVTPGKNGFNFSPGSQRATLTAASLIGVNFSASKVVSTTTYSIIGTISPTASGIAATVTLSGAAGATTTTDSSGNYSFSGLPNGTYAVTPRKNGFNFSPGRQHATVNAANVTGVNFSASKVVSTTTYSITGTINPAANGSGATVTLSGAGSATTTTDSSGNYRFSGLSSGNYAVKPSKNGFRFSPSSESTAISTANVAGLNFAASQTATNTVNIYPGQDIASVVKAAPAGSTLLIYPGIYRLTHPIIPKDGDHFIGQTACAPPATSCPAIISGSTVIGPLAVFDGKNYRVTGQTQSLPRARTDNCLQPSAPLYYGCIYPEDLFFDGVPKFHVYCVSTACNNGTPPPLAPGQWWFDYTNHIIYFHDNPSGHMVETSVVPNGFGGPANNVILQYLTVEEFADVYPNGNTSVSQGVNALTQAANWTIQNSEFRLNHGFGIRAAYQLKVLNNYIHDNGQTGIGGGIGVPENPATHTTNAQILIQGNTINHNNYAYFSPQFGSGGIKFGATNGITVRGNVIQNNEGAAIHFDDESGGFLVEDNLMTNNADSDAFTQEIGNGASIIRNNLILQNGRQVLDTQFGFQIHISTSSNVQSYCNVLEAPPGVGVGGWGISADSRGTDPFHPDQYFASTRNFFHHNTVIFDSSQPDPNGYFHSDTVNQPNFFENNTAPDYNTYHAPSTTAKMFKYDNDNSGRNTSQAFASYQAAGADVHGTADTNYASGFPRLAITSPADESTFHSSVPVAVTASDASGISRVEFYLDWALQSIVTSAPYTFNLTSNAAGPHTITAMAYSNAGIRNCYAITLNEQ